MTKNNVEGGWTLSEIAEIVGGELFGPGDLVIRRPVPAGYNDPEGIAFAETPAYLSAVEKSSVGAVIVPLEEKGCTKPHIRCRNPREAFGRILALHWRDLPIEPGIHPTAIVHPEASVHPSASVGAYVLIARGCAIGEDVKIHPFCYVGEGCRLERGARLYPHVVLYQNVHVGERAVIHSGAVLGADGFGYFWDGQKQRKIPQVGSVVLEEDVEIGALTAVDRATAGETIIHLGTKIDNLVQIAHNVEIGAHTVIAAQTGISGSSAIGSRVTLGGQVGVSDHVTITDDVKVGGQAGITKNLSQPGEYWGTPASEFKEYARLIALMRKLPDLYERVKRLERELERLKERGEER
jgi:UDP-3-O-[3-hydroxymyristoyl] glucosamine N-acyltransferase